MEERILKFLVDHMLGKLARYLRMVGVDTVYVSQPVDVATLVKEACQEKRTILTRNTSLKRIDGFSDFVFINDDQPDKQLSTVLQCFKIHISPDRFFTRCLTCNQKLIAGNHEEVKGKVPPYILEIQKEFYLCPQCGKVYWEGSHLEKMKEIIRKALGEKNTGNNSSDS
jgi:uncharacterized protein